MIGQKGYPPIHGGIEKHVAELAARLGQHGISLDIYSRPHYSDRRGATELDGVTVRRLPSIPTKHFDAITHTALATIDVLGRPADIVHYHALGPALLAGVPRWLARKRTVVTVHGLDWQRDKWGSVATGVLRLGEAASVRFPHRTIVVSRALREYYRQHQRRDTVYIPNGISVPVQRPPRLIREAGLEGPYLLFVGRLVPEKGCHLLLEAYGRLPAALRQQYRLAIAGDAGFTPGYAERLRAMAAPEVHFFGYVHGEILDELYSNTDLLVLPSTLEGLSITLLEGMSYGRCCLVSDIPPNREAAGSWAVTFRSGDAADLEQQLQRILGQPDRRRELGEGACRHVLEHYSWDRVSAETAAVYRDVMAH